MIEVAPLALAMLIFLSCCSPQFPTPASGQNRTSNPSTRENQPLPGVTVFALEPAPVLGVVVDRNMRVIYVEAGGAAEKGGVRIGDVLKRINSKIVTQPGDAREAFYSINSSQKSKLVVIRNGAEITFEIQPAAAIGKPGRPTPTPVPQDMTYF